MTVRFYVIQDVISKEYFWINGKKEGFDKDLTLARKFHSLSEVEERLDWLDIPYTEIKKYYKKESR